MVHIRNMTWADLELGMRLKLAARWNQTETDWRRFLDLEPQGCFVGEVDGQGVGTATTCIFDSVAWIAMVLVDPAARGKGLGTALMSHALAHLDALGVPTVRLDATPLGRPIYEKLGFEIEFDLARYDGTLPVVSPAQPNADIEPVEGPLFAAMHAIDQVITGTRREKLLDRLHADEPAMTRICREQGAIDGYLMSRPGVNATQIGPCGAMTAQAGLALLNDAGVRHAGRRVFVDVPVNNEPAVAWAQGQGLQVQRPFYRMTRGRRVAENPKRLWASSGPEMG